MTFLKTFPGVRGRIRIELTQWGYDVQVYGQTVMRESDYRAALRKAASLRRALSKKYRPAQASE